MASSRESQCTANVSDSKVDLVNLEERPSCAFLPGSSSQVTDNNGWSPEETTPPAYHRARHGSEYALDNRLHSSYNGYSNFFYNNIGILGNSFPNTDYGQSLSSHDNSMPVTQLSHVIATPQYRTRLDNCQQITTPVNNPNCAFGSSNISSAFSSPSSALIFPAFARTQKKCGRAQRNSENLTKAVTKKSVRRNLKNLPGGIGGPSNCAESEQDVYTKSHFQYLPPSYQSWHNRCEDITVSLHPTEPPYGSYTSFMFSPPPEVTTDNLRVGPHVSQSSNWRIAGYEPDRNTAGNHSNKCSATWSATSILSSAGKEQMNFLKMDAPVNQNLANVNMSKMKGNECRNSPSSSSNDCHFMSLAKTSSKFSKYGSKASNMSGLSASAFSQGTGTVVTSTKAVYADQINSLSEALESQLPEKGTTKRANKRAFAEEGTFEEEGIPVGGPVLYMDDLDLIPEEMQHLSGSTAGNSPIRIICLSCGEFGQKADNSDQHQNKDMDASPQEKGRHDNLQKEDIPRDDDDDEAVLSGQNSQKFCHKKDLQLKCLPVDLLDLEQQGGSHMCYGCQKPVYDRYVLHVKDHGYWHADCLKCSNCQDNLSQQNSCYVKNEQVFCRNDYNILFGLSCVKCSLQFKKEQDWMRVAGQHRYHIACFLCKICKRQLGNNEKYHLVNGTDIYCTNHYRDLVNGENSDGHQPPKKAKRNRTSYSEAQIKFLQERFLRDSNPDGSELEKIANHINLKKRVVQVWFQNNRARLKKSANNSKGSNQENKNPSASGPGPLHDPMSMDWDNSLEQSGLDEQTYSSSPPSQLSAGSNHFLDNNYSLTSALNTPMSAPLLCLPPATNGSASGLGHGPSLTGDGSVASTSGTPRDQISPQFSDLSTSGYQASDNVGVTASDVMEDITDVTDNVMTSSSSSSSTTNISPNINCSSKVEAGTSNILSALRSSVVGDRFGESRLRRLDAREQQDSHNMRQMLMFQEQHPYGPLTTTTQQQQQQQQHQHHHQHHHVDSPYGSQIGLYSGLYSMYHNYGLMHPVAGDQTSALSSMSDPHSACLRHRGDLSHPQQQNPLHQISDQPFPSHFNGDSGPVFGNSRHDVSHSGGAAAVRSPFGHSKGHHNSNNNTIAASNNNNNNNNVSGEASPTLSFLQAANSSNPPGHVVTCSYPSNSQGHAGSSPQSSFGSAAGYGRAACASPVSLTRHNGSGQYQLLSLSRNYFVDGDSS